MSYLHDENRFQYNGKELEEDFGIGLHDYGVRWYDASIGRFTTVDPLASDYSFQSPYAYATNNPVLLRDIMGMGVTDWYRNNETGEIFWEEGSKDIEGATNIGSQYIHEGENGFLVHEQNKVVEYILKSTLEEENGSSATESAMVISGALVLDDASVVGVVDDIAIPFIIAGAVAWDIDYDLRNRTYVTYNLINPTRGKTYSGRASGFGSAYQVVLRRYSSHHMRKKGFAFPNLDRYIKGAGGCFAIRGREQQLIDFYGGAQSEGGTSGNPTRGGRDAIC